VNSLLSFPKEKIRVVLLEGIHRNAVGYFQDQGYRNLVQLPAAGEDMYDAHLLGLRSRTRLDRATLERFPRLVAIGCFCIGTNQVDLDYAASRGIPVFNAPHSNTRSVAEMVIGLTVMLLRGVFAKSRLVHDGMWPKTAVGSREVRGKTLGIVGYGHIGSQVSILAESLGMHVIFHDIVTKLPLGNARPVDSLHKLLHQADLVTLHVPQTPLTRNLINEDRIHAMRKGAFLINTSRGVVVDQEALAKGLDDGHLAGAAVDVFPTEPKGHDAALDSPLRGRDNVILTPHVAGSTQEAQEKIGAEVAIKLTGFSDEGATVGAVNFPQLTLAAHEGTHRILHIHKNVPGMLGQINRLVAAENINVSAQHLETRGEIGYVVLDIDKSGSNRLFTKLKGIEGTVRARILH
jgi:D-3-phosphoglycerate dehydrogenase